MNNDNSTYFDTNLRRWNEMAKVHAKSRYYDLDGFRQGKSSLCGTELREIGDIRNKTVLHLMCHFGMDSLSLAKMGAIVTGVDFSDQMVAKAKALSQEVGIPANFIQGNVYDIPLIVKETFDIVYSTYGILCWLPDLDQWAQIISNRLKPGGFVYIAEIHPVGMIMDPEYEEGFLAGDPYFAEPEAYMVDDEVTYTDSEEKIQNTKSYEWRHTMADVINAFINAGLNLEFFHEFPYAVFPMHSEMEMHEDRHWYFKDPQKFNVPLTFSLKARKPAC